MDYRKGKKLMLALALSGALCVVFGEAVFSMGVIGIALLFGAIAAGCAFYRCPHCGYRLMKVRESNPGYCPGCGEKL